MICPAYITATRSAMLATTARSWVTYSAATPVAAAQLAHGLQHHALGGDVQAGGRLVEHQHLGPRQERHRQRDALHLAAGQLMRVAGQELVVVGQTDLAQPGPGPVEALLGRADAVQLQQLDDLSADADRRVEGGAGVLRHVRDLHAADLADLLPRQLEDVLALEHDLAALDERAAPGVGEQRRARGRLARAGLADQADHLAGAQLDVDLVDDVESAPGERDSQVGDGAARLDVGRVLLEQAHQSPRPVSCAMPSAIRLVPMVKTPMMITGASIAQGWTNSASRFS